MNPFSCALDSLCASDRDRRMSDSEDSGYYTRNLGRGGRGRGMDDQSHRSSGQGFRILLPGQRTQPEHGGAPTRVYRFVPNAPGPQGSSASPGPQGAHMAQRSDVTDYRSGQGHPDTAFMGRRGSDAVLDASPRVIRLGGGTGPQLVRIGSGYPEAGQVFRLGGSSQPEYATYGRARAAPQSGMKIISVPGGFRIVSDGAQTPPHPQAQPSVSQSQEHLRFPGGHFARVIPISHESIVSRPDNDSRPRQRPYNTRSTSDSFRSNPYSTVSRTPIIFSSAVNPMGAYTIQNPTTSLDDSSLPDNRDNVWFVRMPSQESTCSSPEPQSPQRHQLTDNMKRFDHHILNNMQSHQESRHAPDSPTITVLRRDSGDGLHERASRSPDPASTTQSQQHSPASKNPNLFNKYKFKFGSIGNFGRSESNEASPRAEIKFHDFDDMVARMRQVNDIAEHPQGCQCQDCQYTCHHKCRPLVTLDCASVAADGKNAERPSRNRSETALVDAEPGADDADSGYHTGHNTLKANTKGQQAGSAPPLEPLRIPSQDTLTREDLRRCIETFNGNQHGLIMTMHCEETSYQGFIRVHMNLIRPINMSISTRPPSIYDVMSHSEDEEEEDPGQEEVTSFYLPKDTSKVIHIECSTTTQEVIKALLTKYKITDNPRKFALYEKLIQDKKERMRRMADDEHPLQLCLEWSKPGLEGLDVHKFVLQENDTGEILWEAFSIPELENFLGILNKEEEDYAEQVKHKYRLLKIQMDRRLKEIRPKASSPPADDKRSPIFV